MHSLSISVNQQRQTSLIHPLCFCFPFLLQLYSFLAFQKKKSFEVVIKLRLVEADSLTSDQDKKRKSPWRNKLRQGEGRLRSRWLMELREAHKSMCPFIYENTQIQANKWNRASRRLLQFLLWCFPPPLSLSFASLSGVQCQTPCVCQKQWHKTPKKKK